MPGPLLLAAIPAAIAAGTAIAKGVPTAYDRANKRRLEWLSQHPQMSEAAQEALRARLQNEVATGVATSGAQARQLMATTGQTSGADIAALRQQDANFRVAGNAYAGQAVADRARQIALERANETEQRLYAKSQRGAQVRADAIRAVGEAASAAGEYAATKGMPGFQQGAVTSNWLRNRNDLSPDVKNHLMSKVGTAGFWVELAKVDPNSFGPGGRFYHKQFWDQYQASSAGVFSADSGTPTNYDLVR